MARLIQVISLSIIIFLISCSGKKVEKVKFKEHESDSANIVKLEKPYKKYTYNWGDTVLASIKYKNRKWVGLSKWGKMNIFPPSITFQPIVFKLNKENKTLSINKRFDIIENGNRAKIKSTHENLYIWYDSGKRRILKKINWNKSKSTQYKLKHGNILTIGLDSSQNYYVSGPPGVITTTYDKIYNIFSENIHTSPKNLPIWKYNQNIEKTDSFGRWIYTGNIKKKRNLFYDITLNQRHILSKDNYIFTCSFNFGFIEKYTLDGECVEQLSLTSASPIFNNMRNNISKDNNETIPSLNMEIVNDKLFILFSGPVKALSGICEYPADKKHFIGIVKVDISGNKIQKEKIYYYFPEKSDKYLSGFTMIDSKTIVLPTKEALEFYKLK